jgi:hypothetical protein
MKKIVIMLIVTVITINCYGQDSGSQSCIDRIPEHLDFYNKHTVSDINNYIGNNTDSIPWRDFEEYIYSFVYDEKLYVVSYDTLVKATVVYMSGNMIEKIVNYNDDFVRDASIVKRDLCLWSIDKNNIWSKVLTIQTDEKKLVDDIWEIDTYVPMSGGIRHGLEYLRSVKKIDDNSFEINLACYRYKSNYHLAWVYYQKSYIVRYFNNRPYLIKIKNNIK